MKPSELLFDIIHALTPQEEVAFLNVASLQQGEKNYLKIYEAIKEMTDYDEVQLKEKFKKEVFIKHLPSEKNQLLHHLLKGLRQNYAAENTASYIREELKNVQVLFNKSLYKLARRALDKIKNLAYEHELFYAVLEIIDLERIIIDIESRFDDNSPDKIRLLMDEKKEILDNIELLTKCEDFYSVCSLFFGQGLNLSDAVREGKIKEKLKDQLLQQLYQISSKRSRIYLLLARAILYRLLLKNEEMFTSITELLSIFEKSTALISEMPRIYLNVHGFLTRYYSINRQYQMTEKVIDKIANLANDRIYSTPDLQMQIFAKLAVNRLMFLSYKGQFNRSNEYLPDIIKGLEQFESKLNKEEVLFLNYTIAINYYGSGLLNKALTYLNKIINEVWSNSKKEILRIARLLNLIVHLELRNTDLLPYLYKSTRRYFDQLNDVQPYEVVFLDFYKKYALSKRQTVHTELLNEFEYALNEVFQNPYYEYALEYFDFYAWIDTKRHRISYQEAVNIKKQIV